MKRKSRLPRQETVEELQELLKRAHNKEEWENIQALYGLQSGQIKTVKGIAFAWSQGGATSIDGGTTLPPEDEILYEILPRLNREEATQKRAQKLAPKPGWESYQPIQQ